MLRSDCTVYSDIPNHRLVYEGMPADEGYWDGHWADRLKPSDIRKADGFVVGVTKRFLPKGARVVDAGCGLSRTVYGLHQAGYDAHGIDYAPDTVSSINQLAPELQVKVGDVRAMPYPDEHFDGVWSLGVIEHFYDGFGDIVEETRRILKPGGYAFVTVPSLSRLRAWKVGLKRYPKWHGDPKNFYQFALSEDAVRKGFLSRGFDLVSVKDRAGFKGLKDESSPVIRRLLQRVYDSKLKPVRIARAGLDRLLAPLTGHSKLYVFRKV